MMCELARDWNYAAAEFTAKALSTFAHAARAKKCLLESAFFAQS
jgi:hypothetical protein